MRRRCVLRSVSTVTCLYFFTGARRVSSCPEGVESIAVSASEPGGCGAPATRARTAAGGEGARVQATLPVTPGRRLRSWSVARAPGNQHRRLQRGRRPRRLLQHDPESAGQGGGASDVRIAPFGLTDRFVLWPAEAEAAAATARAMGLTTAAGRRGPRWRWRRPGMAGSDLDGSVIGGQPGAGGTGEGGAGGSAGTPGGARAEPDR